MRFRVYAVIAFLATGCGSVGISHVTQTYNFDFDQVRDGWIAGAADYPAAQAAAVGAFGAVQALPAPLTTTKLVPYLRGTNVGGGLFLFQKRYFTGLGALSEFGISMAVEIATNYQAGCTTGPGPLTLLKAGVTTEEPVTSTDAQGVVRMSIDKGTDAAAGDFIQFGDIRNALAGCAGPGTFGTRTTLLKTQPTSVITDANGGFWLFIGTQSSFEGQHEIYITGLKLTVELLHP